MLQLQEQLREAVQNGDMETSHGICRIAVSLGENHSRYTYRSVIQAGSSDISIVSVQKMCTVYSTYREGKATSLCTCKHTWSSNQCCCVCASQLSWNYGKKDWLHMWENKKISFAVWIRFWFLHGEVMHSSIYLRGFPGMVNKLVSVVVNNKVYLGLQFV